MKRSIPVLLLTVTSILACKKDSNHSGNNNSNNASGPRAGSTWVYKVKAFTNNGLNVDSFYFNWIARDTTLEGSAWLAIYSKVSTQASWGRLFALQGRPGGWYVTNLTASGSKGLWLPVYPTLFSVFDMYNPVGADYGFDNTVNGKQMQVFSVNYLLNEDGLAYNSLIQAGSSISMATGTISEGIYYQVNGPIMIKHTLDKYTNATAEHEVITWQLAGFNQ